MTNNCVNSINPVLQIAQTSTSALVTCTTATPEDDTIPQITEGDQVLSLAITPNKSTSTLEIVFSCVLDFNALDANCVFALFKDSGPDAIFASFFRASNAVSNGMIAEFRHIMTSGTTSSTTFSVRCGTSGITVAVYINGSSAGGRLMGGVSSTSLVIKEYLS